MQQVWRSFHEKSSELNKNDSRLCWTSHYSNEIDIERVLISMTIIFIKKNRAVVFRMFYYFDAISNTRRQSNAQNGGAKNSTKQRSHSSPYIVFQTLLAIRIYDSGLWETRFVSLESAPVSIDHTCIWFVDSSIIFFTSTVVLINICAFKTSTTTN